MIARRLLTVTLWLFAGHLALGGLYWLLLGVPESNVSMLAASALLALAIAVGLGIVDTTALLWLRPGWTWRGALGGAIRALPAFLLAAIVYFVVSWIAGRLSAYHAAHGSELDAWLIAKFDWTRTQGLHRAIDLAIEILRAVIGVSLAATLLTIAAAESIGDALRLRWIPRALAPRQLVVIAVAIYGLVWLPWQAVYWRPVSLPATSIEVIFAVVKLTIIGLLIHLGEAIVLWAPQRTAAAAQTPAAPAVAVASPAQRPDAPPSPPPPDGAAEPGRV